METMDRDSILRGLTARLEMESGLGVEFMSGSKAGLDLLEELAAKAQNPGPKAPFRAHRTAGADVRTRDSFQDDPARRRPTPQTHSDSPTPTPTPTPTPVDKPAASSSRRMRVPVINVRNSLVPYVEPTPRPEKEAALAAMHDNCLQCESCGLCERRNAVVWGEGDLAAEVMFIGEGPGRDEDAEGRPFVGRSGRLLTDIIEKGMKIPRSQVYITNVVKCRPPGNRDPYPEEVTACSLYLNEQIRVVAPKVIVAVGSVAGRTLLRIEAASGLRGHWHEYEGIPLRVIYHPSYLLRLRRTEHDRSEADRRTWKDIQEVMAKLG